MSIYIPVLGEERDGLCDCGAKATTELQCGWHNGDHGEPSGGQYVEVCKQCYEEYVQWAKDNGQCYRGGTR